MLEPSGPVHEQRDTDTHDRNPDYTKKHPEAVTNEEKAEQMGHAELPLRTAAIRAKEVGEDEVADILTGQAINKATQTGEQYDRDLVVIAEGKKVVAEFIKYIVNSATEEGNKIDLKYAIDLRDFTEKEKNQIFQLANKDLVNILFDQNEIRDLHECANYFGTADRELIPTAIKGKEGLTHGEINEYMQRYRPTKIGIEIAIPYSPEALDALKTNLAEPSEKVSTFIFTVRK